MKLSYEQEYKLVKTLTISAGLSDGDASIVAESICYSDFTGVYSHGLSRFTFYLKQLANAAMYPKPGFKCTGDYGAVLAFDCGNGSGIVSVSKVFDEVLKKTKKFGIAMGTGSAGANIGCGAYYAWKAVKENMILLLCCNTYPLMAPYGGADCLIGSNPIIAAVPGGSAKPIILDISTCVAAQGKIDAAKREGRSIPLGWAKDIDGVLTTDPNKFFTVVPAAEHKGYGLSVIVDLLGAVPAGCL